MGTLQIPNRQNEPAQGAIIRSSKSSHTEAEKAITPFKQICYLSQELALLENGREVKANTSICELDPIGWWGHVESGKLAMPRDLKNPIILPKYSQTSTLILHHAHQQTGHSGKSPILFSWLRANSSPWNCTCIKIKFEMFSAVNSWREGNSWPWCVSRPTTLSTHVCMDYFGPMEAVPISTSGLCPLRSPGESRRVFESGKLIRSPIHADSRVAENQWASAIDNGTHFVAVQTWQTQLWEVEATMSNRLDTGLWTMSYSYGWNSGVKWVKCMKVKYYIYI